MFSHAAPENFPQGCFSNGACFNLEIADTNRKRSQGLMGRLVLPKDAGMLFIFPETGIHSFWMKNTLIPLDILWLSEDFSIVDTLEFSTPLDETPLTPKELARYVLELNAGTIKQNKLTLGQTLTFTRKYGNSSSRE